MSDTRLLRECVRALLSEGNWWDDPAIKDVDDPRFIPAEERWSLMAEESEFKPLVDLIVHADDPKSLVSAAKKAQAAMDAGTSNMSGGMLAYLVGKRKQELKGMTAPRMRGRTDAILRVRDSSGKARARKP